jgi:hypothetical protein
MDTLELGYALGVTALGRRYISTSEICAMPGILWNQIVISI